MKKYIIVYQAHTSFYNPIHKSGDSETILDNFEVEAESKIEAYNKWKSFVKKQYKDSSFNYIINILNIICLEN